MVDQTTPFPSLATGFRVGSWLAEPQLNRLSQGEEEVRVEPKVMQVLVYMAERPGQPVLKEDFFSRVWADTVVTEDVLARCISNLRKVFEDDAREPQYIETIRKRGYRLIAPVVPLFEPEVEENVAPEERLLPEVDRRAPLRAPVFAGSSRDGFVADALLRSQGYGKWVLIAAMLLLLLVGAGFVWRWSTPEEAHTYTATPLTSFVGVEQSPALSPDGNFVAFVWNGGSVGPTDVYMKQVGAERPLRITETGAEERAPVWSPDGQQLAFVRYDGLEYSIVVAASFGGGERKVATFGPREVRHVAWSPAHPEWLIASVQERSEAGFVLILISIQRGEQRVLTDPPPSMLGDLYPVFSPDGSQVAFVRTITEGLADVFVIPVDGTTARQLTRDGVEVSGLAWTVDGQQLVMASRRGGTSGLWKVPVGGGTPVRLAAAVEGSTLLQPSISREGGRLAFAQHIFDLNIWQRTRGRASDTAVVTSTRWESHPDFSPDGSRLAFSSRRSGYYEIWTSDARGGDLLQLTRFEGPFLSAPRWSPGGVAVAFVAQRENGRGDLYLIGTEGGGLRQLTESTSDEAAPTWSRDGRWIYFASNRTGRWEIWKVGFEGKEVLQVTVGGGRMAHESLDGEALYFTRPGEAGIWRMPVRGGAAVRVASGPDPGDWSNWAVGADGLYYLVRDPSGATVYQTRFSDGATLPLERVGDIPALHSFAVSPRGDRFLYTKVDRNESDLMLIEGFQ